MFDYKKTPYPEKIFALLSHYKTSTALAQALEITRMTLVSWCNFSLEECLNRIRTENKEKIDFLWCKHIFLPRLSSQSLEDTNDNIAIEDSEGVGLESLLTEPEILSQAIKQFVFGSLEIETSVSQQDFDTVIEKRKPPYGANVQNVLEIQNIWTLNNKIVGNHIAHIEQKISINQIKNWHLILMSGVSDKAGEFSKKFRMIPATNLILTHPDDIEEELAYWIQTYKKPKTLTDIAAAHSHFELIHPFSDGNGRIGRSIVLFQCLELGLMPPLINKNNKEMYYALLEPSQKNNIHQPLALFFKEASNELKNILSVHQTKTSIRNIYPGM